MPNTASKRNLASKPTVFISSSTETLHFARSLAQELESFASPMVWSDQAFEAFSPVTTQLTTAIGRCDFAVCLLDDSGFESRDGERFGPARQNAIFELGFVAGALGVDRLLIITIRNRAYREALLPPDLLGLMHISVPGEAAGDKSRYAFLIGNEVRRRLRSLEPRPEQLASSFSCFISYSHHDQSFATRLHEDLTEIGVRCWLDSHELRVGNSIVDTIEGGLRASDRMVAVLSAQAVESHWLATELRLAIDLEKQRSSRVILPVRLDNSVLHSSEPLWEAIRERYIADFTEWADPRQYKRAFASLARELTLSVAAEGSPL